MNIIYNVYTSISDLLLSDFLFEIEFYTNKSKSLDEYNKKHNTPASASVPLVPAIKVKANHKIVTSDAQDSKYKKNKFFLIFIQKK
ncbi:hypothetical protein HNP37_003152 [Flavobacterium nitrogenifigens]|uniref:Uncharacterized protein n=2 Tax=Flavobacterium TaxID=237 RepID=A0A7W7IYW4_9FLAO|nr:hypothetical protein [Flavobacterium nitrogenifigens]MBB6388035.1 hypothetical protein [Flavobacterium notoginsengisoli]